MVEVIHRQARQPRVSGRGMPSQIYPHDSRFAADIKDTQQIHV